MYSNYSGTTLLSRPCEVYARVVESGSHDGQELRSAPSACWSPAGPPFVKAGGGGSVGCSGNHMIASLLFADDRVGATERGPPMFAGAVFS